MIIKSRLSDFKTVNGTIPSSQLVSSYGETHKPLQDKYILIFKKEIFGEC
jgi:hypothetical protein